MPDGYDFDHTSFAVTDAIAAARWARRELGATPIHGEVLPDFRYVLMHVGDDRGGGRIEFMEPVGSGGFLARFIDRHGERPHHLTFTVPDVTDVAERLRGAGLMVVGEDYTHPPWREAFVMPDAVHGTVIQIADSTGSFPSPSELLSTTRRSWQGFPSNRGATGQDWWTEAWDESPGTPAVLVESEIGSTDLDVSDHVFGGVLGGKPTASGRSHHVYSWPRARLNIRPATRPGIKGLSLGRRAVPERPLSLTGIPIRARALPS